MLIASVAVMGLLMLSACSAGGGGGSGEVATLRIVAGAVDISADGASFSAGTDGQQLSEGTTVRTGADGRASIEWFDGSVTRLDHSTTFTIITMAILEDDSTVILGEQTSGNSYNRVTELTDAASRFDIDTPTATASVQGTEYAIITTSEGTLFLVLNGSVTSSSEIDEQLVQAGQMVTATSDGSISDPVPIPPELLDSDWITFNCEDNPLCPDTLGPEDPPDPPGNFDPVAKFYAAPQAGPAPLFVIFYDLSTDLDGDDLEYLWDFGDGSTSTASGLLVHIFHEPGEYVVELTVTDPEGASDSQSETVGVAVPPTTTTFAAPQVVTTTTTTSTSTTTTSTTVPTTTTTTTLSPGPVASIELAGSTSHLGVGCDRTFTAYLLDANGNLVDDDSTVVTFAEVDPGSSGGGHLIYHGGPAATAADGVATKTVTASETGSVKLRASASGLLSNRVEFQVHPSCANGASLVPSGGDGFGNAPFGVAAGALLVILSLGLVAVRRRPHLA
ncbi:MAG TPA: PKD domain-containing protein [Acidimicrobiia bacterium]|nr:PKD domain-containing protein [Acidimicrobiia bacterium]